VSAISDVLSSYQHVVDEFVIVMGTKGAFEFTVNDDLVFSKKSLGRHAEPGEILSIFEGIVGPDVAKYPDSK